MASATNIPNDLEFYAVRCCDTPAPPVRKIYAPLIGPKLLQGQGIQN